MTNSRLTVFVPWACFVFILSIFSHKHIFNIKKTICVKRRRSNLKNIAYFKKQKLLYKVVLLYTITYICDALDKYPNKLMGSIKKHYHKLICHPLKNRWCNAKLCYFILAIGASPICNQQMCLAAENHNYQKTKDVNNEGKITYQGVVVDDTDMPLPGVNVTFKNAKGVGVVTDLDGKFSIAIPENVRSLIFSYVGMKTQTINLSGNRDNIKVRLEPDVVSLQETVITGIYTRKVESFTGSMATYSEKDLKIIGNQNVLQSLKALDPSFIILENNLAGSDPNATMNLNIGGSTNIVGLETEYTTNPNQPLFILDGFETTLSTITDLSMDRIASITILKDASSTAIYGAKAANGVVVVETKKPEAGRLRFNYNGNFGVE